MHLETETRSCSALGAITQVRVGGWFVLRLALQYQDGSQPSFKCLHRFLKNQVPQPNVPKNEDPAAIAIRTPKTAEALRPNEFRNASDPPHKPPDGPDVTTVKTLQKETVGAFMLRSVGKAPAAQAGSLPQPLPPLRAHVQHRHPAQALSAPACRSASRQSRWPKRAASISAVLPRTRGASLSTPSPT